jgi:hypothetical protein
MLPKTFIFFAVSCISVVTAAGLTDNILEDFSTVKGNGNYIIHLRPETNIKKCMYVKKIFLIFIDIFFSCS